VTQASGLLIYSAYIAQAAGALLLAVVFLVLYRFYHHRYLMDWAWSAWAGALAFSGGAVAIAVMKEFPFMHPARQAVSYLSIVAGYWQVVWLLAGAWESGGTRLASRRAVRWGLWVIPLAAVAFGIFFSMVMQKPEVPLLGRLALAGVANQVAALWVLRGWGAQPFFGRGLVAASLALTGLVGLHNAASHLIVSLLQIQPSYMSYIPYVPYLSILLQYLLGLGVVMWLLEGERARALKASAQVERLAYYDALTGLPNRGLLVERLSLVLAKARTSSNIPALVSLDLDRFKVVNDSLGHSVGDALLGAVAHRLRSVVRPEDTLARLGGDEFAVLLSSRTSREEVIGVAQALLESLHTPFVLMGQEVLITASLGAGIYPEAGLEASELLKSAGVALSKACDRGGGCVEIFEPGMDSKAVERLQLESSLRRALSNEEFALHYQPILNARTGAVAGVEALLRWHHPEKGLVGPGEFLFMAEAAGIADGLDLWVLLTACTRIRGWQTMSGQSLTASVNLSAKPFQHPDLVTRVAHVLHQSGLKAESLELEITETIAMQDPESTQEILRSLQRIGVKVAIDDFGTGYSSLGMLQNLPVNTLKMDRAFVHPLGRDEKSAAIAGSIVLLAHGLGLKVIAEGVETEAQRTALATMGCDMIQGFLVGRPMPAAECEKFLLGHWTGSARRVVG
jgi:diguanylate cyclase (GGDEF)-like protein